jgi:hypothetical protein
LWLTGGQLWPKEEQTCQVGRSNFFVRVSHDQLAIGINNIIVVSSALLLALFPDCTQIRITMSEKNEPIVEAAVENLSLEVISYLLNCASMLCIQSINQLKLNLF